MVTRAVFEPGLRGTGPTPVHLHTGKPTPWSEGCVVRFELDDGPSWIGNLQPGWGYAKKIISWETADAMIVIANGAAYFINLTKPDNWKFLDSNAIDCVLAPASELAILSTYTDVVAITTLGTVLWPQTRCHRWRGHSANRKRHHLRRRRYRSPG